MMHFVLGNFTGDVSDDYTNSMIVDDLKSLCMTQTYPCQLVHVQLPFGAGTGTWSLWFGAECGFVLSVWSYRYISDFETTSQKGLKSQGVVPLFHDLAHCTNNFSL